jgi:hypothetical protein
LENPLFIDTGYGAELKKELNSTLRELGFNPIAQ